MPDLDLPDDNEMKRRAERWNQIFKQFENSGEAEDDGMNMDELVAQAEAEDEMDGVLQHDDDEDCDNGYIDSDSGDEAIEDNSEETEIDRAIAANPNMSYEEKMKLIMSEYPPGSIELLKEAFKRREKEIEAMNLPHWNPPPE
jgi:hypothetical protein